MRAREGVAEPRAEPPATVPLPIRPSRSSQPPLHSQPRISQPHSAPLSVSVTALTAEIGHFAVRSPFPLSPPCGR